MSDGGGAAACPPVRVAPDGPALSAVVAGAWRLASWGMDVAARVRWIEACLDLGVTTFDHADIYGGYTVEGLFGEALAAAPGLRDRLQLVTKCGITLVSGARRAHRVHAYDSSRAHVLASVDASLAALRTDRVDVLLIHRPDWLVEPDALAATFTELRAAGKVLAFGVSNHRPSQLALLRDAMTRAGLPLVTHQLELSPLALGALDDGTLDQCLALGVRPMAWSPLGGGRLFTSDDERARRVRAALDAIAAERGTTAAAVAFAWIARHPAGPLPITGTRRVEGIAEAVRGVALAPALARDEWYRVWEASAGREVP